MADRKREIFLGLDANRRHVYLSPKIRQTTHMHVIGGSGTGKSKFLEWLIRKDIEQGQGLCIIDWHGSLADGILEWCHYHDVGIFDDNRSVVIVNPSKPDFVTGFNPFVSDGSDISTQVSRRIDATIRPWGQTDTNEMPTFERTCRAVFSFMVETRETLPNAAKLLEFPEWKLREYAVSVVREPQAAKIWREFQRMSSDKRSGESEWRKQVLSTENRLARFLGSTAIRRFMGLPTGNLDLETAMDEGKIVIVNLAYSDFLPTDAARVFASLFLNQFFETAMRRVKRFRGNPPPFILYLDEFQEYITDDIAAMLNEVRKGGLHLVLAHQHLGHFADNPKLRKAVFTNARIRTVFGGLDYEDACKCGDEMFLPDLNTRQIKKAYWHTAHIFREELRESETKGRTTTETWNTSKSSGHGTSDGTSQSEGSVESTGGSTMMPSGEEETEGWFTESSGTSSISTSGSTHSHSLSTSESESEGGSDSESYSVTTGTVFVPIPIKELGSESEWSREEKLSKIAEMLKYQQQRHCFIKIDNERTQPLRVPDVHTPNVEPETLQEYEIMLYKQQGSLPAEEVDRLIEENEQNFLRRVHSTPARERTQTPRPGVAVNIATDDDSDDGLDPSN